MTRSASSNIDTEALQVSADRIVVTFKHGGAVQLNAVVRRGSIERALRAVPHAAGEYLFDVRRLAPELGDELCVTEPRDIPFLLAMTFKLRYTRADAFMSDVIANQLQGSEAAA